jgi:integrase
MHSFASRIFRYAVSTAHGFRAIASTLLNESGKWNPDAIERALAHKSTAGVRGAYHRGAPWEERVAMAHGGQIIPNLCARHEAHGMKRAVFGGRFP